MQQNQGRILHNYDPCFDQNVWCVKYALQKGPLPLHQTPTYLIFCSLILVFLAIRGIDFILLPEFWFWHETLASRPCSADPETRAAPRQRSWSSSPDKECSSAPSPATTWSQFQSWPDPHSTSLPAACPTERPSHSSRSAAPARRLSSRRRRGARASRCRRLRRRFRPPWRGDRPSRRRKPRRGKPRDILPLVGSFLGTNLRTRTFFRARGCPTAVRASPLRWWVGPFRRRNGAT